ncbi:hypothetical protein DSM112329_02909 [Paraconexibacter sp. AEG42_29]|uniref:Uncharacterized protein n=1 Tax=Paraconexibacter sp. AEG42_29 TaxID=2997339 RepID=A0AAU7AWH6_9ACTN
MRPLDAETRLITMLADAGVTVTDGRGAGENAPAAWQAFCELAHEPADEPFRDGERTYRVSDDEDCDLLLHESFAGDENDYVIAFTRQFSLEGKDGEYVGMRALTLQLQFAELPAGRVPKAQRWGYAGRRREGVSDSEHSEISNWAGYVDNWKAAVERSNSFRVMDDLQVQGFTISQGDI